MLIPAAAILLPSACSGSTGDDARVVPRGLAIDALPGGNGVLDVIALTLKASPGGAELYAALKNDGDVPACDAALSVELFDKTRSSVAAGIGAIFTRQFYRLNDGSGTIAACVGPGDVSMAAVTDLPSALSVDDLGTVVYRCPYFALDVVPLDALTIPRVTRVARAAETAYAGTLVNELDLAVSNPSVTVFPLSEVGRPLGVTVAKGKDAIPSGGSWAFETSSIQTTAASYAAYPAGAFAN